MRLNQRGWQPIEDDPRWEEDDYYDKVALTCDALAKTWSRIYYTAEQEEFQRQWHIEEGRYDYEYEDESDAVYMDTMRRLKNEQERRNIEAIEDELNNLGARLMREYEHWNEDERYMAYMERDR